MGIFYLFLAKVCAIGKMIAMKKCGKLASGAKNSLLINSIRSMGCAGISLIICLFSGFDAMSGEGYFVSALSGIANAGLLFLWVLCAERCSLCTVEIFCMIGGVVIPLLISPLIFVGETITVFQWLGAIILLPAAYCFSSKKKEEKKVSAGSFLLLICACLANAGCVTTQKVYTYYGYGSIADFNLITFLVCTASLLFVLICFRAIKSKNCEKEVNVSDNFGKNQIIVYIILAIVMLYASQYLGTLSSESLKSALFFPLSYAISMPLTLLTDILIFKERLNIKSIIGLSLVIISIYFINI